MIKMNNTKQTLTKTNTYENKLYSCKNFEFPYLEIKKYEENEYYLAFLKTKN